MSQTISSSDTVSLVPSGYTGLTSLTTTTSYPVSNGYTDSSSTTYARFTLSSGATGYLYYTFDTSDIPSGATIDSVTCSVRARVSSTSRITNTNAQLYTGTTAKGNSSTFASTSSTNTFSLSTGTWTRSELDDLRLRIGGTGSSGSGGGSSRYIYFYGAEVTIEYSYQETVYEITLTNNTGITTDPSASTTASNGSTYKLSLYNEGADIIVTDNGVDVTSQLVETEPSSGGTQTYTPASYTSASLNSTNYCGYCIGYSAESPYSSTSNTYSSGSGTVGHIDYSFGIDSSIFPSNATITAVTCAATGHCENASQSSEVSRVTLYLDGGAISDTEDFTSTSNTTVNLTATTLPAISNVDSLVLRHEVGYYGGLVNGATLSITYTVPSTANNYYVYTITSVSADHVIVVSGASTESDTLYMKINGSWYVVKPYKEVNGSCTEQSDVTSVFEDGVNYFWGA